MKNVPDRGLGTKKRTLLPGVKGRSVPPTQRGPKETLPLLRPGQCKGVDRWGKVREKSKKEEASCLSESLCRKFKKGAIGCKNGFDDEKRGREAEGGVLPDLKRRMQHVPGKCPEKRHRVQRANRQFGEGKERGEHRHGKGDCRGGGWGGVVGGGVFFGGGGGGGGFFFGGCWGLGGGGGLGWGFLGWKVLGFVGFGGSYWGEGSFFGGGVGFGVCWGGVFGISECRGGGEGGSLGVGGVYFWVFGLWEKAGRKLSSGGVFWGVFGARGWGCVGAGLWVGGGGEGGGFFLGGFGGGFLGGFVKRKRVWVGLGGGVFWGGGGVDGLVGVCGAERREGQELSGCEPHEGLWCDWEGKIKQRKRSTHTGGCRRLYRSEGVTQLRTATPFIEQGREL